MRSGGAVGWLEWQYQFPEDAAVPTPVRRAIAHALTEMGRVTFVVAEPHPSMTMASASQRAVARLVKPAPIQGTTRDPAGVELLFEDPLQAWWLGGAAAIVSAPDNDVPILDAATWRALAGDDWTTWADGLPRVNAVLRAGVDGEMAGWWSRDEALRERFAASLCKRVTDDG